MLRASTFLLSLHVLLTVCLSAGLLFGAPDRAVAQESDSTQTVGAGDDVAALWIDLGLQPQLVEEFNRTARPNDVARADHISMVDLLDAVTVGRKLVVFKSVVDVEMLLPRIGDKFDIIGYNLEHGPSNRPDEQADPVGSMIRLRELADQYGKEIALGPDRSFAISDGVAMAPYADMMILQVQRVQTEPETVRDFVEPLATQYRAVNPDLEISIQIRTEGDVIQLGELVASLTDTLDGISILTSPETIDVADALITELRPNGAALPAMVQAAPTTTLAAGKSDAGGQAITPPTAIGNSPEATSMPENAPPSPATTSVDAVAATGTTTEKETITAISTPIAPVDTEDFDRSWFMVGSLITIGILGGGLLIASIIYAYQNIWQR